MDQQGRGESLSGLRRDIFQWKGDNVDNRVSYIIFPKKRDQKGTKKRPNCIVSTSKKVTSKIMEIGYTLDRLFPI